MMCRNEEPRAKQATLAALTPLKQKLVDQLRAGNGDNDPQLFARLMRLINADDEPLLRELLTTYLFDPSKRVAGVSLMGHNALVLLNFYLGYCRSDEQVAKANQV